MDIQQKVSSLNSTLKIRSWEILPAFGLPLGRLPAVAWMLVPIGGHNICPTFSTAQGNCHDKPNQARYSLSDQTGFLALFLNLSSCGRKLLSVVRMEDGI